MKTRRLKRSFLLLFQLCMVILPLVCLSGPAVAQSVTVRLVNGKNGKPIARAKVYISFDGDKARDTLDLRTDSRGEVQFDPDGSRTFRIHQIGYATCDEQPLGTIPRDFSVKDVLEIGFVSANSCGHLKVQRKPGQLVFFVRHGTWGEWLKQ